MPACFAVKLVSIIFLVCVHPFGLQRLPLPSQFGEPAPYLGDAAEGQGQGGSGGYAQGGLHQVARDAGERAYEIAREDAVVEPVAEYHDGLGGKSGRNYAPGPLPARAVHERGRGRHKRLYDQRRRDVDGVAADEVGEGRAYPAGRRAIGPAQQEGPQQHDRVAEVHVAARGAGYAYRQRRHAGERRYERRHYEDAGVVSHVLFRVHVFASTWDSCILRRMWYYWNIHFRNI